jgi:hypothetical protein
VQAVVTTTSGARRLGGNAVGFKPWQTHVYEGWGHFHEGRPAIEAAFGSDDRLTWLTPGLAQPV